jgi:hypothetical protein
LCYAAIAVPDADGLDLDQSRPNTGEADLGADLGADLEELP